MSSTLLSVFEKETLVICDFQDQMSAQVQTAISMLQRRLQEQDQSRLTARDKLLLRLNQQYPGDVGVLAALFLNHLILRKGQVIISVLGMEYLPHSIFCHYLFL